ncbi:MAG: DNA recombinase [Candidatus Lumbricidophila eiseniae]|uniref:DNA recombinase n=1 Tax=Candidatus Lumbricidiphila eiseniae TaxID=1969409 RepID=A0A2A6FQL4_9MICO|nr:MAG: DNA recombinase [Candidatus Lumbricidophila eiseniae]
MDFSSLLVGFLLGVLVGAVAVGLLLTRRFTATRGEDPALIESRQLAQLAEVRAYEESLRSALREELAATQSTVGGLREQIALVQQQYQEVVERHRADQKAREERDRAESRVLQELAPVKESLTQMQSKVTELESQRSLQHGEITQQLKAAAESEERLRSTAESLASALRSNNTRGVWGETQLRNVVEAAGLLEHVDFSLQESMTGESGALRPDMTVRLPGGKSIAVDAKVPFNAYLEANQIPATATGAEAARRSELLKQHVQAVRSHITSLSAKGYWTALDSSPELVIAFIPSESLVSAALETDPTIMDFAFSRRVALASPVTLWSVLKTVAFTWQQDILTNEAKTLFDLSRELYSRLTKTAEHIDKLGRSINGTVKNYNAFIGSLERSVLPTARKLNALDSTKLIPTLTGIEEPTRRLTAPELLPDDQSDKPLAVTDTKFGDTVKPAGAAEVNNASIDPELHQQPKTPNNKGFD